MDLSSPLLDGRLTRRGMSWLAGSVLIVTPFQSMMLESTALDLMLVVRAIALGAVLFGLRTERIGPVSAGRAFLVIGLLDMVASAFVFGPDADGVVIEAISYGTILSVFTLLIAPGRTRRRWSGAVTGVVAATAAIRLVPGEELMLLQVVVVFTVHTAVVLALDMHANRAEEAGAMAAIDPLTGLVNRRPAIDRMTEALVDGADERRPSSAIMVDLDRFKAVNDTLGHEAGDDALRRVAGVLSGAVRGADTVSRWGGEEFLVILPGVDIGAAARIAERMRAGVERRGLTASFGVAGCVESDTVAEWVRRADTAMFVAKRNGRNQVCVDDRVRPTSRSVIS